jgi:hypothetical protein
LLGGESHLGLADADDVFASSFSRKFGSEFWVRHETAVQAVGAQAADCLTSVDKVDFLKGLSLNFGYFLCLASNGFLKENKNWLKY